MKMVIIMWSLTRVCYKKVRDAISMIRTGSGISSFFTLTMMKEVQAFKDKVELTKTGAHIFRVRVEPQTNAND